MRSNFPHLKLQVIFGLCVLLASQGRSEESVFEENAKPQLVAEGAGEGPAWDPKLGMLFSGDGHIMRWDRAGKTSIYRENAGSNGLLFDSSGNLLICEPVRRQVSRLDREGKLAVLTDQYQGSRYNQPNDITVDSHGRIYFSDPCYGPCADLEMKDEQGRKVEGVYRIDPDHKVTRIITHEVDRPNGLVVTPDDRYLYVADNNNNTLDENKQVIGGRKLWRFDLKDAGTVDVESQKLIYDWGDSRGPDGMVLDQRGRIYVAGGLNKPNPPFETNASKGGVYVFSPAGKLLEFVPIPRDEVTNCTFGGDDLRTLFVTAGGTLWSVRTTTPGQMPWPKK